LNRLESFFLLRPLQNAAACSLVVGFSFEHLNRLKSISRSSLCLQLVKRLLYFPKPPAVQKRFSFARRIVLRLLPGIVLDVLHVCLRDSHAGHARLEECVKEEGEWERQPASSGSLFFRNIVTGETRWDEPGGRVTTKAAAEAVHQAAGSFATETSAGKRGIRSCESILLPRQLSDRFSPQVLSSPLVPLSIVNGDTFVIVSQRGEGDFGCVHEVFHRELNGFYALKKLKRKTRKQRHVDACLREVDIMSRLRCSPHVVRYQDSWIHDYLHIQMELCEGNLSQVSGAKLHSEDFMLRVLCHVACALSSMHGLGFVHLDIKPDNIYVVTDPCSKLPTYKLGDFGTARSVSDTEDIEDGSNIYMAPELLGMSDACFSSAQSAAHCSLVKADIFSLGVMVYEAVRGQRMTAHCIHTLRDTGFMPRFPESISDELYTTPTPNTITVYSYCFEVVYRYALLARMTNRDPCLRPSARDITRLPRMQSMLISSPELLPSLDVHL
jgi:serine/threonine protein kinase